MGRIMVLLNVEWKGELLENILNRSASETVVVEKILLPQIGDRSGYFYLHPIDKY